MFFVLEIYESYWSDLILYMSRNVSIIIDLIWHWSCCLLFRFWFLLFIVLMIRLGLYRYSTDIFFTAFQSTMMQVTISAGRLPQFREMLHARTMFSVSGFEVSRCAQNFRFTDSSLMIRFNESTSFQKLTEPVSPLPEEAFRFHNQSELIGLANTNTQLPGMLITTETSLYVVDALSI